MNSNRKVLGCNILFFIFDVILICGFIALLGFSIALAVLIIKELISPTDAYDSYGKVNIFVTLLSMSLNGLIFRSVIFHFQLYARFLHGCFLGNADIDLLGCPYVLMVA